MNSRMDDKLEQEIVNQVERNGALIAGEFEEASDAGLVKYIISVHQAVEHLETLCAPIVDEKYREDKPSQIEQLDKKIDNESFGQILNKAKVKHRHLIRLLTREGVL